MIPLGILASSHYEDGESSINLFSQGGCESTSGWTLLLSALATDTDNKYEGVKCLKITLGTGRTNGTAYVDIKGLLNTSKYYLASAYLKNGNAATGLKLIATCTGDKGNIVSSVISVTDYTRVGVIMQPSDFDGATAVTFGVRVDGTETQYCYFDACMLNEITADDYAAGIAACLETYVYTSP